MSSTYTEIHQRLRVLEDRARWPGAVHTFAPTLTFNAWGESGGAIVGYGREASTIVALPDGGVHVVIVSGEVFIDLGSDVGPFYIEIGSRRQSMIAGKATTFAYAVKTEADSVGIAIEVVTDPALFGEPFFPPVFGGEPDNAVIARNVQLIAVAL